MGRRESGEMGREDHCCMEDGERATCVLYVCVWASNRKGREKLERMVEAHVMMCIAGDFNGHVGLGPGPAQTRCV